MKSKNIIPGEEQRILENELFERAERATQADEDTVLQKMPTKLDKILKSTQSRLPLVKRLIQQVSLLYKMLKDKRFTMEWQSKAIIISALFYFVMPFDFMPDYIPMIGFIDDAFVVSAALNAIAGEIERYADCIGGSRKS